MCVALSLQLVLLTIVLGLNTVNVNSGGIVPIILLYVQCMLITVKLVLYGCPWNHGT